MIDTRQAVRRLAQEHPDWVVVLRAACEQAKESEPFGGEFAGSYVVDRVSRMAGQPIRVPGLRMFVAYGVLEKCGPSTRGGRRAYYRMPDREGVERALAELPMPSP